MADVARLTDEKHVQVKVIVPEGRKTIPPDLIPGMSPDCRAKRLNITVSYTSAVFAELGKNIQVIAVSCPENRRVHCLAKCLLHR